MWKFSALILCLSTLVACSLNNESSFTVPENIIIEDNNLLSPFFIEQLTEDPIKEFPAWNDSLISTLEITQIDIENRGLDNPESLMEQFKFFFRRQGNLSVYNHFNNSNQPSTKTEISYQTDGVNTKGTLKKYFNEEVNKDFVMLNRNGRMDYVRQRSQNISDTFRIYGTVRRPKVIMQKSGNYVLNVNFIVNEDQPLSVIQKMCKEFQISEETIANADLTVTYVNRKYLPISTYHLNDLGVQTNLVANWEYDNLRLLSYSKYVNNNLIKDFSFEYGTDKLLKSFTFNQVPFTVTYR